MHQWNERGHEGRVQQPILVVEDDLDAQCLVAEILERRGHRVVTRANGQEALRYLREGPMPRLILLDLQMPLMDGYELYETMAADAMLAAIPVVLVTDVRSIDQSRVNPKAILTKPLKVQQLVSVVDQFA